jgi:hypothetical protein
MFTSLEVDGTGVNESRGFACEIVAWQMLTYLSEKELIDYLLYELPVREQNTEEPNGDGNPQAIKASSRNNHDAEADEYTGLLDHQSDRITESFRPPPRDMHSSSSDSRGDLNVAKAAAADNQFAYFEGLNALEIAGVASAKKFLSQVTVQKIVEDIWNGDVIFW